MNVYEFCVAANQSGNETTILKCIANGLQTTTESITTDVESLSQGVDIFFLIFAAALMFVMQAGFAMLCAGCVRHKNIQNTILKNLLDTCGAGLAFWSVGYAFAYGGTGEGIFGGNVDSSKPETTATTTTFIGNTNFFLMGVEDYSFWLYQYAFAATAATIVAGTLAERCQMAAYLWFSIFLTAFVYPVIVHTVWSTNGALSPLRPDPLWNVGMIDFAGSGVVHVTGGFTALIASRILGPRKGRFEDDSGSNSKSPLAAASGKKIEGHSSSLQSLGTFILWFGWYGFNTGSIHQVSNVNFAQIASLSAVSTTLGAASGCVSALGVSAIMALKRTGEVAWNLSDGLNGTLAGLVGITGGCGMLEPWASVVVGAVGGCIYLWSSNFLVRLRVDDAVDAIPVHLVSGMWSLIAVGLFASPRHLDTIYGRSDHVGWFYSFTRGGSDATLLGINLLGLLFILGWVLFTMTPFFLFLSYAGWFRADSLEEIIGLDPGSNSHQTAETITNAHLEALQAQLNERSATVVQEAEEVTCTNEEDRFEPNS